MFDKDQAERVTRALETLAMEASNRMAAKATAVMRALANDTDTAIAEAVADKRAHILHMKCNARVRRLFAEQDVWKRRELGRRISPAQHEVLRDVLEALVSTGELVADGQTYSIARS